jgi:hypothetical protein
MTKSLVWSRILGLGRCQFRLSDSKNIGCPFLEIDGANPGRRGYFTFSDRTMPNCFGERCNSFGWTKIVLHENDEEDNAP